MTDIIPQKRLPQGRPLKNNGACTKCGETDPDKFYYFTLKGKRHKRSQCKKCHYEGRGTSSTKWYNNNKERSAISHKQWMDAHPEYLLRWNLQNNYGLSIQDLENLIVSQDGLCKICHEPPREGERLHIDHCHQTGKVRGLLCKQCNVGLGCFRDTPFFLRNAADYLEQ